MSELCITHILMTPQPKSCDNFTQSFHIAVEKHGGTVSIPVEPRKLKVKQRSKKSPNTIFWILLSVLLVQFEIGMVSVQVDHKSYTYDLNRNCWPHSQPFQSSKTIGRDNKGLTFFRVFLTCLTISIEGTILAL